MNTLILRHLAGLIIPTPYPAAARTAYAEAFETAAEAAHPAITATIAALTHALPDDDDWKTRRGMGGVTEQIEYALTGITHWQAASLLTREPDGGPERTRFQWTATTITTAARRGLTRTPAGERARVAEDHIRGILHRLWAYGTHASWILNTIEEAARAAENGETRDPTTARIGADIRPIPGLAALVCAVVSDDGHDFYPPF